MSPRNYDTDAEDAADWKADRNWWRHDPYADPDYRSNPAESNEPEPAGSEAAGEAAGEAPGGPK